MRATMMRTIARCEDRVPESGSLCVSLRPASHSSRTLTLLSQFDQFYPREIRRNRRTYERIILLGLAIVVLVLLLSGGKSGNGRPSMLEKAKMRGARRKNVSLAPLAPDG